MKEQITQEVFGCKECIFLFYEDMGTGCVCSLQEKLVGDREAYIKTRRHQPITPEWCPLKKNDVLFVFRND